jgi:purine-cytosine permease-like protein
VATTEIHDGSVGDEAFRVETRGIDFVPEVERWATPRNIGAMWAGSAINVEYFIYGALLMGFGFSFWTAVSIIVIGNLSFLLLGVASLQGQETGTTAFTVSRAAFGTRGSRVVSFFNWLTQLGFETEGLILIVAAAIVLSQYAGFHPNSAVKVIFIVVATAIQAVLPFLGHATMVKVLRALIIPFAVIFVIFAIIEGLHAHPSAVFVFAHGWEPYTAGLAFTIALSGLGWTECGNDYTRYLPRDAKKGSVVGWIFVGTALPEIAVMILGALAFSFMSTSTIWNSSNPFQAVYDQKGVPSWFVVIFLVFAIVQLFGINSLDLYSSGVSVQAMGLRLRRYQAVLMDSVIACALTIWATFGSTFSIYMKDFVGVIIVWIAPWFGIYITDWLLRRFRYNAAEMQKQTSDGIYWAHGGFNWSAIVAFVVGLVLATTAYSKAPPPVNFPLHWMTPFSNHYGAFYCNGTAKANCGPAGWFGGADMSVFFGIFSAALVYFLLEKVTGTVARQVRQQQELEPHAS